MAVFSDDVVNYLRDKNVNTALTSIVLDIHIVLDILIVLGIHLVQGEVPGYGPNRGNLEKINDDNLHRSFICFSYK